MTWQMYSKRNFNWNQYVVISVNGEKQTNVVQVKDTHMFDEYNVDDVFSYNKCAYVKLVK